MSMILKEMVKPKTAKQVNFQAEPNQLKVIKEKAKKYTKGNVSEWVRYASLKYEPAKSELMTDKSPH